MVFLQYQICRHFIVCHTLKPAPNDLWLEINQWFLKTGGLNSTSTNANFSSRIVTPVYNDHQNQHDKRSSTIDFCLIQAAFNTGSTIEAGRSRTLDITCLHGPLFVILKVVSIDRFHCVIKSRAFTRSPPSSDQVCFIPMRLHKRGSIVVFYTNAPTKMPMS